MGSQIYELLISYVGGGVYLNASLAANYTVSLDMDGMSPHFFQITPTGADREFILPAPSAELVGLPFLVSSTAASGGYNILVKAKTILIASPFTLSAASTIGTIAPGATAYAICRSDGTYYRWSYQSLTPGGLSASGSSFSSTEQTATGSPQNIAHGLGRTPTVVWAYVTDSGATGIYTLVPATHDGTNIVFNGTAGIKYRAFAL